MKVLALDADTAARFWGMYEAAYPYLVDMDRSPETFRMFCLDRNTQIFHGPSGSVVMLTGVNMPQHTAAVHLFSESPWAFRKVEEFRKLLLELMELFHLYKLNVFIPGPAGVVQKLYALLGFKEEGILRKSAMVDQELEDLVIYGVLREELKEPLDAKRNRVSKRRSSLLERTFGKSA